MTRYASRKFIAFLLALGSITWLAVEKILTSSDYKTALISISAAYLASNVAQKATVKSE